MKKRNVTIDIAKGIGIILVILGHLDTTGQFSRDMIYSCHMPLFFLLSGVFHSSRLDFKSYMKKGARTLLVPFFVFFVLDFCYSLLKDFLSNSLDLAATLKAYALALPGLKFYIVNTPIWFLLALFMVRGICYFVNKNKALQLIAIAVGAGATFVLPRLNLWHRILPLVILPAIAFYVMGTLLSKQILNLDEEIKKNKLGFALTFVAVFVAFVIVVRRNIQVDLLEYFYGNPFLFFAGAFLGIFSILIFSSFLSVIDINLLSKPLCFFGENSIYILVWHYYFCRKIFPKIVEKIGFSDIMYSIPIQLLGAAITLTISLLIIYIFNHFFYFLFGKSKPVKQK